MGVEVASFLVFAASMVGTPGPANMALLATGARAGLRRALPFVAGVVLGKQLIIWPLGLGLMQMANTAPWIFTTLKWVSAAYIFWLAWRIAGASIKPAQASEKVPGFAAGLIVHPLNPKAWAMVTGGFTNFVEPGTPALQATAVIAICLLACQALLHPMWAFAGERLARVIAGTPAERYLMWVLAGLTVLSVVFVLFLGGKT